MRPNTCSPWNCESDAHICMCSLSDALAAFVVQRHAFLPNADKDSTLFTSNRAAAMLLPPSRSWLNDVKAVGVLTRRTTISCTPLGTILHFAKFYCATESVRSRTWWTTKAKHLPATVAVNISTLLALCPTVRSSTMRTALPKSFNKGGQGKAWVPFLVVCLLVVVVCFVPRETKKKTCHCGW